jgi:hypothetical protein
MGLDLSRDVRSIPSELNGIGVTSARFLPEPEVFLSAA